MKQLNNNSKDLKGLPSKKPSKNFELYIFLTSIIIIIFMGFLSNRISVLESKVSQLEGSKPYIPSWYSNQSKVNELENQIEKLRNKVYDLEESNDSSVKNNFKLNDYFSTEDRRWSNIDKGMSKATVERILGKPDRKVDDNKRFSYWFYDVSPNEQYVTFIDGRVDDWKGG